MDICLRIEKTNWSFRQKGECFCSSSISCFSQYFRRMMKCQPYEYRQIVKYNQSSTSHFLRKEEKNEQGGGYKKK
jgi:hypothetical protein